jgi:hypothetical protein
MEKVIKVLLLIVFTFSVTVALAQAKNIFINTSWKIEAQVYNGSQIVKLDNIEQFSKAFTEITLASKDSVMYNSNGGKEELLQTAKETFNYLKALKFRFYKDFVHIINSNNNETSRKGKYEFSKKDGILKIKYNDSNNWETSTVEFGKNGIMIKSLTNDVPGVLLKKIIK